MTRLRDDCFAVDGPLQSIEAAVARMLAQVPVVAGLEAVPLAEADGRIAGEDAHARNALPPFANAAVDGYAVRAAELGGADGAVLAVSSRIAAGAAAAGALAPGTAARIFTGAPIPAGADTVVMQENVTPEDATRQTGRGASSVRLPPGVVHGANVRRAGEDVSQGDCVVPAGRRLRPGDLALAAAAGLDRVQVRRRLRVALFSTGDELVEPGAPLRPGAIHDANRVMLAALLGRLGARVSDLGILRDDPAALARRLAAAAADHDLVLTSGGVSVGEEDHVKGAVEASGRLVQWRLAIKPGKPVAMGVIAGTPFVGLPGNPVAAYVTLLFVVRPLLDRLGGAVSAMPLPQPVRAGFAHRRAPGRREFLRVGLVRAADGGLEARRDPRQGSGMLATLAASDGLAEIHEETGDVAVGDFVGFYPHALLW